MMLSCSPDAVMLVKVKHATARQVLDYVIMELMLVMLSYILGYSN